MSDSPAPRGDALAAPAEVPPEASPLTGGRGTTTIDDGVVEKIATHAAREVEGVLSLGSGVGRAVAGAAARVGLGDERRQGASVEVGEREAAVDLDAVLAYGADVREVAREIRRNVVRRVEGMTGLRVAEVNVTVSDVRPAREAS